MLVAIAIPIFTTQLEKSREATDLANLRSAYAEQMTAILSEESPAAITVTSKQKQDKWQSLDGEPDNAALGNDTYGSVSVPCKHSGATWTVKVNDDGDGVEIE